MWDTCSFSFSREKFMFSRITPIMRNRACWERKFRDGRKRWQKKTGEKRPRNCAMAGLDYTVTLASSIENALSRWRRLLPSFFLPRSFSLARVDPRRQAKPHKGNIADRASTASSSPDVPSSSSRFPHSGPTLFYLFFSVFLSSSVSSSLRSSSRRANLLGRYVQIDTGWVRGPRSRVPRYLILPW